VNVLSGLMGIGIDLHRLKAPYQPALAADDDTRHFDEDIPNEVSTTLLKSRYG
jgi:hypothetical protein